MSKKSLAKNAPKAGTSLVEQQRVQAKHSAIAKSALRKNRSPSEQLTPDERATLGK